MFSYPYLSTTRVIIITINKHNEVIVEKRDPKALGIALVGKKKYSMLNDGTYGTIIFDIHDRNFSKIIEGEKK